VTYEPRTYRRSVAPEGLVAFEVVVRETDLFILAERDLTVRATELVLDARAQLESYISVVPRFAESFVPLDVPATAPPLVRQMAAAARATGVGPFAAVAGAVAEHVARGLAASSAEVVVENGGDDFLLLARERVVAIHAGVSPLSGHVGLRVAAEATPLAIATSSGTVGPSVSLGSADAVTILARDGALADAAASAVGNRVHGPCDVTCALELAQSLEGVAGAVVIVGDAIGAWGSVELVGLDGA
jgi:ApbE superfamily uncharacterized protein (UPF0280 family)